MRELRTLRLFSLAFVQASSPALGAARCGRRWRFGFEMVCCYLRLDWDEAAAWRGARIRPDMAARPYHGE